MSKVERPIPVLIENYLANLADKKNNIYNRDNVASVLETIRERIDVALKEFNQEKNRLLDQKNVRKRA